MLFRYSRTIQTPMARSALVLLVALALATQVSGDSRGRHGVITYALRQVSPLSGVVPLARTTAATWCGSTPVTTDRVDELAGAQVHVVYALPADGEDRFLAVASPLVADLIAIDGWWRAQDPGRTPRFDQFAFPGCDASLNRLDLGFVRLGNNTAYYGSTQGMAWLRIVEDAVASSSGLDSSHKKVLIIYDGVHPEPRLCGVTPRDASRGGAYSSAVVFLRSACGSDLGNGGLFADTMAHELMHSLGAVPDEAPHQCASSGHACDDNRDIMAGFAQPLAGAILDVGRDDYYGHAGRWWDVQDSDWLRNVSAPPVTLTISLGRSTGQGRVVSNPPGIDCPPTCSTSWDSGTRITLVGAPLGRTRFVGWLGACAGRDECRLVMTRPNVVDAVFIRRVVLRLSVIRRGGAGTVRGTLRGFCPDACIHELDKGAKVTLRARPAPRSRFLGWSGRCAGRGTCSFEVDRDSQVTARFGPASRSS